VFRSSKVMIRSEKRPDDTYMLHVCGPFQFADILPRAFHRAGIPP
jgi:hypothetical protein